MPRCDRRSCDGDWASAPPKLYHHPRNSMAHETVGPLANRDTREAQHADSRSQSVDRPVFIAWQREDDRSARHRVRLHAAAQPRTPSQGSQGWASCISGNTRLSVSTRGRCSARSWRVSSRASSAMEGMPAREEENTEAHAACTSPRTGSPCAAAAATPPHRTGRENAPDK